jgi:hypothetical protein
MLLQMSVVFTCNKQTLIGQECPTLTSHGSSFCCQLIDGLISLRKERFAQFDDTLSQNTRSIEKSIGNIIRAQNKLAEHYRPILHELVASQSRDNNNPVHTSSTMQTPSNHDTHDSIHRTPPSSSGHLVLFDK